MFAAIFTPVVDLVKGYIEGRKTIQQAKVANEARLLQDTQSNNAKWEMASLTQSGKMLKVMSFAMFSFPMVWAVFDPTQVGVYFENLKAVPIWWVQSWVAITGSIWGIATLKDAAPQLISGVKQALRKQPPVIQ